MIHGKDIQIFGTNGVLLAAAKSCTIHKECDTIETANASNGYEKTFVAGRSSWSVNMSYLILAGLAGIPLVGTTYTIIVKVNGSSVMTGSVICTECDIQAASGNLATGSIKMQGTGSLA